MRDYLIIYVNGRRHEVTGARAFQSLSDFLRYDLGLTGTKVVCAEGDCGSCTVFIGTPAADGRIEYRTVTSCIQYLCQLDCTHVVTVEGLKHDGKLNAIQESMVRCQGAQCGFCTPGFIVSMQAMLEAKRSIDEHDVRSACVGNLCRCTGYEPIIRAAIETDVSEFQALEQLYPAREFIGDLVLNQADPVLIRAEGKAFFKPVTIQSAAQFRLGNPHCAIIAGGTDLGVQMNKGVREPQTFLSLSGLREMRDITREADTLIVGATASLSDFERACADSIPENARMLYYFGSPPIRNAGTLGGNIANGSPIADTLPALYVLNAQIEVTGTGGSRRVNINDFYTDYKKTVMLADELITRVFIPLPVHDDIFRLYKISRRKDLDISAFTAAFWMRRNGNGSIEDARIAYGGVGPNVIRLRKTEEFLRGNSFDEATFDDASEIARGEIMPISDVRGSADYRFQLGENVMRKFFAEVAENGSSPVAVGGSGNGEVP